MNKNKEATFFSDYLRCVCGTLNSVYQLIDEISSDLSVAFNNYSEGTEKIICAECKREYKLTLSLSVSVNIDSYKIEEISKEVYYDKNNNLIEPVQFENLIVGIEAPDFLDGEYKYKDKIYQIENGVVESIFSNEPHPNQISLFDNDETIERMVKKDVSNH